MRISDWSSDVCSSDLVLPTLIAGYDAVVAGRVVPPAPSNTLQYGDYAVWRERQLATRPVARQLDYWRDKLSGVQGSLQLASDRPYPAAPTRRGGMERFALPPALTRSLEALGRSHGETLYMVLPAAFGALLHRTKIGRAHV